MAPLFQNAPSPKEYRECSSPKTVLSKACQIYTNMNNGGEQFGKGDNPNVSVSFDWETR